jgi:pyruvate kinase
MAAEEVPLVQQELVRLAAKASRPVIVATQMLESMIDNPRPTRAEVSDVAFAAMAQADAVMLSAETAVGKYPVAAVRTMDKVLRQVEGYQWKQMQRGLLPAPQESAAGSFDLAHLLSRATSLMTRDTPVRAIVVPTRSGRTARMVASRRPGAPVIAVSDDESLCRRLGLIWGVSAERVTTSLLSDPATLARETAKRLELATDGEHVLLVWDLNLSHQGLAPTVTILAV